MTQLEAFRIAKRQYSAIRRERLKAEGLCISSRSHGPATHGVVCAACRIVHKYGKATAEAVSR